MEDYEDGIDKDVNDIISQIKNQSKMVNDVETVYPELTPEGVEEFILSSSSKIITDILIAVDNAKTNVTTPDEMTAFARLTKAATSSIEMLQKRIIADNKNKTQKEVTKLNLEGKSSSPVGDTPNISFSRDEILEALMNKKEEEKEKVENGDDESVTVDI